MRNAFAEDELTEIRADRHEDSILGGSPLQERAVSRVRSPLVRLRDIVAPSPKPFRKAPPRAAVDQKPH